MVISIKTIDSSYLLNENYTMDIVYSMLEDKQHPHEFIKVLLYDGSKIIIAKSFITSIYEVDEKKLCNNVIF